VSDTDEELKSQPSDDDELKTQPSDEDEIENPEDVAADTVTPQVDSLQSEPDASDVRETESNEPSGQAEAPFVSGEKLAETQEAERKVEAVVEEAPPTSVEEAEPAPGPTKSAEAEEPAATMPEPEPVTPAEEPTATEPEPAQPAEPESVEPAAEAEAAPEMPKPIEPAAEAEPTADAEAAEPEVPEPMEPAAEAETPEPVEPAAEAETPAEQEAPEPMEPAAEVEPSAQPETPAEPEEESTPVSAPAPFEMPARGAEPQVEAPAAEAELQSSAVAVEEAPAPEPEPEPEEEREQLPASLRSGEWFVVHTYAGYENKVKANLETRIRSMNMEDRIFEVVIPMEDVMEFKGGKKQVIQKKKFPGYLLVRMDLDDDSWYVVRNTQSVTGFVGSGAKPTPLAGREVDKILQVKPV
jgi:transcriptional antiterminator NusG